MSAHCASFLSATCLRFLYEVRRLDIVLQIGLQILGDIHSMKVPNAPTTNYRQVHDLLVLSHLHEKQGAVLWLRSN